MSICEISSPNQFGKRKSKFNSWFEKNGTKIIDEAEAKKVYNEKIYGNSVVSCWECIRSLHFYINQKDINRGKILRILEVFKKKDFSKFNNTEKSEIFYFILLFNEIWDCFEDELSSAIDIYELIYLNCNEFKDCKELEACCKIEFKTMIDFMVRCYLKLNNLEKALEYSLISARKFEEAMVVYYACRLNREVKNLNIDIELTELLKKVVKKEIKDLEFKGEYLGVIFANKELSRYYLERKKYIEAEQCLNKIEALCNDYDKLKDEERNLCKREEIEELKQITKNEIEQIENSNEYVEQKYISQFGTTEWALLKHQHEDIDNNTSQKFVFTAYKCRDLFNENIVNMELDYSCVLLPLYKAIENELYEYCIMRLNKWVEDNDIDPIEEKIDKAINFFNGATAAPTLRDYINIIVKNNSTVKDFSDFSLKEGFKKYLKFSLEENQKEYKSKSDLLQKTCEKLNGKIDERNDIAHRGFVPKRGFVSKNTQDLGKIVQDFNDLFNDLIECLKNITKVFNRGC